MSAAAGASADTQRAPPAERHPTPGLAPLPQAWFERDAEMVKKDLATLKDVLEAQAKA